MTVERYLLILMTAIAVGQAYAIWSSAARRPAWWRRVDLHHLERVILERHDRMESNMTAVMAGLHEDMDGLRQEIRAMASLPPETAIPHIVRELRVMRVGGALLAAAVLVLLGLLITTANGGQLGFAR